MRTGYSRKWNGSEQRLRGNCHDRRESARVSSATGDDNDPESRHRYLLLASIGIFPFLVNGPVNARIAHLPGLYWAFELSIRAAVPLIVLYAAMRTPGFRFADLGFHTAVMNCRGITFVLLACLAFAPLGFWVCDAVFEALDQWYPGSGYFQYETVIPETGIGRQVVVLYFAASAGLVEEFPFRGLLYRAAQELGRPRLFFVLVSPLLFSLVHWESGTANLLATWVYGLFVAAAYLLLRNLWPLIFGHVLTDLIWFY